MTDSALFNIDETLIRVYQELSSHQQRLDSMEQSRLELVNFNRLLSFLPKPTLPKQEDSYINQEAVNYQADSWGEEDRIQYPAV